MQVSALPTAPVSPVANLRSREIAWTRTKAIVGLGADSVRRAIHLSPLRSRRGHVSWRFLSRKALVRSRRLSRLPLGDRDQCRQFVGRRFRASTITACVGTDGTDGRPRPRSPGCRLARGSGHLIAAGTRAAPTRPFGKRDRASCRSSVGGRRLCRAHNSAITGSHDYTADPTTQPWHCASRPRCPGPPSNANLPAAAQLTPRTSAWLQQRHCGSLRAPAETACSVPVCLQLGLIVANGLAVLVSARWRTPSSPAAD